jgi:tetratricopeptide (TPR) repeat protein
VLQTLTNDRVVGSDAKVRLAMIDYSNGRAAAALEAIDEILRESPRQVLALIAKADMLFDQGRAEDSLAQTRRAVAADPSSAAAHFAQGKLLAAMQRIESAIEAFNTVLRLNPRAASAKVELSKLYLRMGGADSAVALAGAAVTDNPRRVDARLVLARGLIHRGDHVRAEAILSDLAAAFPDSPVVHAQIGWLNVAKNDAAGARTAFQRALGLDPVQIDALSGILGLDMLARRLHDVRARLEMAIPRAPRDAPLLTLAGRMYSLIGEATEAEQMLTRAISADANFVQAYTLLGRLYLQQSRIEEARVEFERRAERETRPVAALTMVGLICELQNRPDAARRVFEQVIGLDPNAPVAANNLAWIYAEHGGDLDAALQLAHRARTALPESGETHDTLGWIYLKKELFGPSISAFLEAVEREPTNPTFQYHLGLAYARSGDQDRARQALQAALRLRPEFDGANEARRVLAGL